MTLNDLYTWLKEQEFSFVVKEWRSKDSVFTIVDETKTFYVDDIKGFNNNEFKLNNNKYLELEVHETLNCLRILYVNKQIISNIKKLKVKELTVETTMLGSYAYFFIELKQLGKVILEDV